MFCKPDIHTHDKNRIDTAIINISPGDEIIIGGTYSVGIHPWESENATLRQLDLLEKYCSRNEIVAIGETGLDALRGGELEKQKILFKKHIELSEKHQKPLIIHAVKTFGELIAIHKNIRPAMPWILHGFRGKPQQAIELIKRGFYISLGEKFNRETATIIPEERLLFESDESSLSINEIIKRINDVRNKNRG